MFSDHNNIVPDDQYSYTIVEENGVEKVVMSIISGSKFRISKKLINQIKNYKEEIEDCYPWIPDSAIPVKINGAYCSFDVCDAYIVGNNVNFEFILDAPDDTKLKIKNFLMNNKWIMYATVSGDSINLIEIK